MAGIKARATQANVFQRLQRLRGPEAAKAIESVIERLDHGDAQGGIDALMAADDLIGGYCGLTPMFSKPPGAYRPLGYIATFLENHHPREMARYIIDTICQHVENLLQRIGRLGFLNSMSQDLFPMGRLVRSMQRILPPQLYMDLQWLASEVYNNAKHSTDVSDRATAEERAYYFQLEEALAIYLIGRQLAVQLEQWSGKSREVLMAEM